MPPVWGLVVFRHISVETLMSRIIKYVSSNMFCLNPHFVYQLYGMPVMAFVPEQDVQC